MPLLYLLMERGHTVMKRAHDVVLHREELYIIEYSMYSVHSAIRDRVEKLQGMDSHLRCVLSMANRDCRHL